MHNQRLFSYDNWSSRSPATRVVDLFVISALGLFLEVLLVRWLGSEIRVFAYFKNFTLVTCFFGLGLGFVLSRRSWNAFPLFPLFLTLTVGLVVAVEPVLRRRLRHLPSAEELHVWSLNDAERVGQSVLFYGTISIAFLVITILFVPLGQLTGRLMNSFAPLRAYTVNLAGAILGVVGFGILSFGWTTPFAWLVTASIATCFLCRHRMRLFVPATLLLCLATATVYDNRATIHWSPYQKLEVSRMGLPTDSDAPFADGGYTLDTNQDYHQKLLPLSEPYLAQHGREYPDLIKAKQGYDIPYGLKPRPERVLILGAGTGNDVAAALRNRARGVTAVEIDPLIVELGRQLHPDQPYASRRVRTYTGDARSFIQQDHEQYDLIVYGLVDSHTLLSGRSEVRLDNFLYTRESFRAAGRRLKPDGVLTLSFSIPSDRRWLANRIFYMLGEVFGESPVCRSTGYDRATSFAIGVSPNELGPEWQECTAELSAQPPVTLSSDDWPYLYLRDKSIPQIYLMVIAIALTLSVVLLVTLVPETRRLQGHFFFLGAAFMLVEVKAVTELALVFGTTWLVSSIAILGILTLALGANLWVQRFPLHSLKWAYVLLFSSLTLGYVFPKDWLLANGPLVGGTVAAILLSMPVFFAGLVFSTLLSKQKSIEGAFGSNLFGSMFGGFFEYTSLALGIRNLYLLAALFYALTMIFSRSWLRRSG